MFLRCFYLQFIRQSTRTTTRIEYVFIIMYSIIIILQKILYQQVASAIVVYIGIVLYAYSFDNVKDVNATLGSACANVQIAALAGQIYEMVGHYLFIYLLFILVSHGVCLQKF
jgi:hypothetical protein